MKGVPPEIDVLMWQLAEEGGPTAQAEFEARHARYAPELARRIRMVAELRQAGKAPVRRPTFTPRPTRTASTPRWAVAGTVGLAVLAVGALAFVLASDRNTPPAKPAVVDTRPERTLPLKEEPTQITPPQPLPVVPPNKEESLAGPPPYTVPRDVRIAETNLTSAIMLVAQGGGLKATVAPGFRDQTVTLDYRGLNTIQTLKAMGEQYGFTVIEEEEGHVLVLPARVADEPSRRVGP